MGQPEFPSSGQQSETSDPLAMIRGTAGALAGAVIGFVIFTLLIKYVGVYAMAIPGAMVGLIGGYASRKRSLVLGIVCAAIAAATMIFAEWWNFPFQKDESLGFFLQNFGQLTTRFWLSLLLGGGLAFWFGQGNERTTSRHGS
ncbi:MAG: hypothetical protein K8R36_14570 [Planctomycetales bacterium]|nr:hypothetical protein [Planctomycetales bacterium]